MTQQQIRTKVTDLNAVKRQLAFSMNSADQEILRLQNLCQHPDHTEGFEKSIKTSDVCRDCQKDLMK